MKDTGISRSIDDLGRIVIPVELRKSMGIDKQDSLQIFVKDDQIILKKQVVACVACGVEAGLLKVGKKELHFCQGCLDEMNRLSRNNGE